MEALQPVTFLRPPVSEVALALMLLAGAGLLMRTFGSMKAIDPGFEARNVLTMRVSLPGAKYADDAQRTRFFEQAVARISAIPGRRGVALTRVEFDALNAAGAALLMTPADEKQVLNEGADPLKVF